MKRIAAPIFIFLSFFCIEKTLSQGGMWTWVNGDSTMDLPPVFGTQGIPDSLNHPSGAYEGCEWTDKQGNFWFFESMMPFTGWDNDLWKYNPATNKWAWMKGPGVSNDTGNYGVQGIPSAANLPSCRGFGIASWTDTSGIFWMYGGCHNLGGFKTFSDLWKFDIATNNWTWINGPNIPNQLPVYGVQGIPSPANSPGARMEAACTWVDNNNNLWIFGAEDGNGGQHNDLWKYDISTNEWTWMKGSDTLDSPGFYGTQGVTNVLNTPSARAAYSKWKDSAGNFWMFGGWERYMACPFGNNVPYYNDMWKYDVGSNEWVWINGPDFCGDVGSYSPVCFTSPTNLPVSRMESRSCWVDNAGDFWMFGGLAVDTSITYYAMWLNDMWKYSPVNNEWKLIWGDTIPNQHGDFGIKGVASPCNRPLGRMGSVSWYEPNINSMFLFGGYQYDIPGSGNQRSEMWRYDFDTTCVSIPCLVFPTASLAGSNSLCPGTCTDFLNLSLNATSYQWNFPGATPDTSSTMNPQNICYPVTGSYDVQLIAFNANGSDTLLLTNYITVYSTPPQSISQSGDTLFAIAGSSFYQWYFNGNIINGATDYLYVAQQSGDYNMVATDINGCEVEAAIFNVVASAETAAGNMQLAIFPNPVESKLEFRSAVFGVTSAEILIYDLLGEMVLAASLQTANCKLPTCSIDVSQLPPGLYYLVISAQGKSFRTRFVKK
jgi:hypothetical protein